MHRKRVVPYLSSPCPSVPLSALVRSTQAIHWSNCSPLCICSVPYDQHLLCTPVCDAMHRDGGLILAMEGQGSERRGPLAVTLPWGCGLPHHTSSFFPLVSPLLLLLHPNTRCIATETSLDNWVASSKPS
jgi:hypothetical protein